MGNVMMGSDAKFFGFTNALLGIPSGMFFVYVIPKSFFPVSIGVSPLISHLSSLIIFQMQLS